MRDSLDSTTVWFRAGDWVEVRDPREIAQTLDADGTLGGLPFMPEMLEYCGKRFRVLRRAEKTCIEFSAGYRVQEFQNNDAIVLEGLRCSGASHDGCQRACTIFWKSAWLRRVKTGQPEFSPDPTSQEELRARLKTMSAPDRYFCQSTELGRATQPLRRPRMLLKCLYEIRSGSRGVLEMARLVLVPLWRKTGERLGFPRPWLTGSLKRTPVGDLKLHIGEWVRIKSAEEIAKTLDEQGRNRGLRCDYDMCRYSGGTHQVRSRLDRMISEATGKMRQVEGTVTLENLNCLCHYSVLGGCPRQDFMYWREVWLERAERAHESSVNRSSQGEQTRS